MASKKYLFVELNKASSYLSNVTFKPEKQFKAYDNPATGRDLFIHIDFIRQQDNILAMALEKAIAELTSTKE